MSNCWLTNTAGWENTVYYWLGNSYLKMMDDIKAAEDKRAWDIILKSLDFKPSDK